MSLLRKAIKIAVKETATQFFQGSAKELGQAVGEDLARTYRRLRGLPEPEKKGDDE